MKALFLADVPETTLKPLTDDLAKSMVPIMNKPLLERNIENLRRRGVDEIMIGFSSGFQAIRDYFGDGKRFGLKIEYVAEEPSVGIGGILKKAGRLFGSTFLALNEGVLCNMELSDLIRTHRSKSAGVTVAVTQADGSCEKDGIEFDENGYAVFHGRNAGSYGRGSVMASAGIYAVEPFAVKKIPESTKVLKIRDLFPVLMENGVKIAVCQGCSYWMDVSTPEQYLQVHKDILAGDCQIADSLFDGRNVLKDGKSVIDSTAVITGPVYIGDNVRIGAYATIGPNAVIGDDVCVHMGGKVVDSVLWENVDVGICAKLRGSIAVSDCKVKRKAVYTDTAFTNTYSVAWKKNGAKPADKLEA